MADRAWSSTNSTDASLAGNYSGNAAPATGDTLILNAVGTANLSTNLGYYTNVAGCTINALDGFVANVGAEASGTNAATYLVLGSSGTTNAYIGRTGGGLVGNGSPLFLLDGSSGTLKVNVYKTGSKTGSYPCLCVKGSAVTVNAYGGEMGFAVRPGETGTLSALNLLRSEDASTSPVVRCGKGATMPSTVIVERGTLYSNSTSTITTLKVSGPDAVFVSEADSTGAITNVVLTEGRMIHKGTGGITTATVRANCTLDLTQDAQSKTLNTVYADAGAKVLLDNGNPSSITHSAGGTNLVTIVCTGGLGTVTISAPAGMQLSIQ